MHTGGGGEGEGFFKFFEKLPHKNAIKHDPPPSFSHNPEYPPQKEFAKKPKDPPPLDLQPLCIYVVR